VLELASMATRRLAEENTRVCELEWLVPLQMTGATFLENHNKLERDFLDQLMSAMAKLDDPPAARMVVAGVDAGGAALFVADRKQVYSRGLVGFVSCGSGSVHADAYFARVGHSKAMPLATALFHVLAAKKAGEVAPGVGKKTDLFIADRNGAAILIQEQVAEVEKAYWEAEEGARASTEKVLGEVADSFRAFREAESRCPRD